MSNKKPEYSRKEWVILANKVNKMIGELYDMRKQSYDMMPIVFSRGVDNAIDGLKRFKCEAEDEMFKRCPEIRKSDNPDDLKIFYGGR